MTMTLISTVTVGSGGAASIDFTSIAGTYTDLQLVLSARLDYTSGNPWYPISIKPNNSTSSITFRRLYGTGSATGSATDTALAPEVDPANATSNTFASVSAYIPNYAGSTYKSFSMESSTENNGTAALSQIMAGLWSNTSAITSLILTPLSGNFVQYSTASLYGIKSGSGGATVS